MFIEGQEDGPTKRVIGVVSAVLLVWSAMAVAFAQAAQQRVDGRINIEGWTVVGEVGLSPAASVDGISEYTVVWEIRDEHGNPVTDLSNLTCTYTYTGMASPVQMGTGQTWTLSADVLPVAHTANGRYQGTLTGFLATGTYTFKLTGRTTDGRDVEAEFTVTS